MILVRFENGFIYLKDGKLPRVEEIDKEKYFIIDYLGKVDGKKVFEAIYDGKPIKILDAFEIVDKRILYLVLRRIARIACEIFNLKSEYKCYPLEIKENEIFVYFESCRTCGLENYFEDFEEILKELGIKVKYEGFADFGDFWVAKFNLYK